jgi:hypothetical protein
MTLDDPLWDDLWPACAFAAFVQVAIDTGGPPDSEKVRRLAYRHYEAQMKEKNATTNGKEST